MIVNYDTGQVVDARTFNVVAIIVKNKKIDYIPMPEPSSDLLKSEVWKDFWFILKKFNETLLNAAQTGNIDIVKQLLDPD